MHLADDIHIARIDRRAVVLDLARDRYLGLGANLAAGLFRVVESRTEACPETEGCAEDVELTHALAALARRGILADGPRREPADTLSIDRGVESLWPTSSATFPPR